MPIVLSCATVRIKPEVNLRHALLGRVVYPSGCYKPSTSCMSNSPDGRWAVTPDFRRLHDTRPGYGYAGLADPFPGMGASQIL